MLAELAFHVLLSLPILLFLDHVLLDSHVRLINITLGYDLL